MGEKDKLDTRDPALRHCDSLDTRDCTFGRVGHEIVDNASLVCIRPNSLRIMAYQDRSEALGGGDIVLRAGDPSAVGGLEHEVRREKG